MISAQFHPGQTCHTISSTSPALQFPSTSPHCLMPPILSHLPKLCFLSPLPCKPQHHTRAHPRLCSMFHALFNHACHALNSRLDDILPNPAFAPSTSPKIFHTPCIRATPPLRNRPMLHARSIFHLPVERGFPQNHLSISPLSRVLCLSIPCRASIHLYFTFPRSRSSKVAAALQYNRSVYHCTIIHVTHTAPSDICHAAVSGTAASAPREKKYPTETSCSSNLKTSTWCLLTAFSSTLHFCMAAARPIHLQRCENYRRIALCFNSFRGIRAVSHTLNSYAHSALPMECPSLNLHSALALL